MASCRVARGRVASGRVARGRVSQQACRSRIATAGLAQQGCQSRVATATIDASIAPKHNCYSMVATAGLPQQNCHCRIATAALPQQVSTEEVPHDGSHTFHGKASCNFSYMVQETMSLLDEIFAALDCDGDGLLSVAELRPLADTPVFPWRR